MLLLQTAQPSTGSDMVLLGFLTAIVGGVVALTTLILKQREDRRIRQEKKEDREREERYDRRASDRFTDSGDRPLGSVRDLELCREERDRVQLEHTNLVERHKLAIEELDYFAGRDSRQTKEIVRLHKIIEDGGLTT